MKFSLRFLRSYLSTLESAKTVAEALVQLGFEIEGTETRGFCGSGPLVVGQVKTKVPHPDSDHLSVCRVDVGQTEPLQIVCGAQNFQVGDFVPVALEGARLGDIVLKKTVMRGVESCGMMCSADELGLSATRAKGLLILNDRQVAVGMPVADLFRDQQDTLLDVSIPSNRGDGLSYIGLVRELSALFGGMVNETPSFAKDSQNDSQQKSYNKNLSTCLQEARDFLQAQSKPIKPFFSIETEACDYFSGCWLENMTIQPSPEPIQAFLQASGLRPINNVVDMTNVVLLEQGQPLHAFDAEFLQGNLHIRKAKPGETLQTLEGKTHALPENATVVADDRGVLSVAGVMGGKNSGISEKTQQIFIECAHFDAGNIRVTSQKMGLSSDSSYRFERFVDKTRAPLALMRAIELLRETNPNLTVKFFAEDGSYEAKPRILTVRLEKINRLLGFPITAESFCTSLEKLQFSFQEMQPGEWEVTIPSWREDITQEVDFAEEWLRLNGTDTIPSQLPGGAACELPDAPEHLLRLRHAAILSQAGFYEAYTDSLQPKAWYEGFLPTETLSALCLEKPLSEEHACLRFSLIPGLVNALSENQNHGNSTERLFETGRIFKVTTKGQLCECFATAFVVGFSPKRNWKSMESCDFYQAQTWVRTLIEAGGQPSTSVMTATKAEIPLWQAQYAGKIGYWEQRGFEADLGYLDLSFTQRWFKNEVILAAECFWLPERIRIASPKLFQPYAETPTITKDLALWVPKETLCETVRQSLVKSLKKLVKHPVQVRDVRVFDVFQEASRKSFAFSLVFGADQGTLTDEQVQPLFDALQAQIDQAGTYRIRKLN